MSSQSGASRLPFNLVDQLIFHLDQAAEPWSVQCEVRVGGRLDAHRLAAAAREAAARHPLTRARMELPAPWARRHVWQVDDSVPAIPLEEVDCLDDDALAELRSRVLSRHVDLQAGPPLTLTLAHHPAGDAVMINLHHCAGDGMSAHRFMTSLARAYSGQQDPTPALDLPSARDLRAHIGTRSLAQARSRLRGLAQRVRAYRADGAPARIAVQGGRTDEAGFGFELVHLDREQTRAVLEQRVQGATVNDLMLAGLGLAIRSFNDERGVRPARVSVMMPVNLRPEHWRQELLSNIVSFVPVVVPVHTSGDPSAHLEHTQRAVAAETRALKDDERAGTMIDLLAASSGTPARLRHRLHRRLMPRLEQVLDTSVLSNLGRLDGGLDFGTAGPATRLWFSPPARMPLGVAIGVVTLDGELCLTIRYCKAQFDAAGAAAFAARWRAVLLGDQDATPHAERSA